MAQLFKDARWIAPKISWGPIPTPRSSHFAFEHSGKMFIFGGVFAQPGPNERDCIYSIDAKSMIWQEHKTTGTSPQLEQRRKSNCVYHDGHLYCFTSDGRIVTAFKLNLSLFTWENTPCTGTPPALEQTAMVVLNGSVLAWGGSSVNANAINAAFFRCPLDTLVWTSATATNTPLNRYNHTMFVYNGLPYVLGGHASSATLPYPAMALFKLETGGAFPIWRPNDLRGASPSSREGHTAVVFGNKVVVVGGVHHFWSGGAESMDFCDTNVVDFSTDSWWPVDQIRGANHAPSPRHNHSAVVVGNNMFVFGGTRDGKAHYNDMTVLSLAAEKSESGLEEVLAQSASVASHKTTSKLLEEVYNNETMFPDVCFKAQNKSFFAHKVILSARSSVLKKRFEVAPRSRSSFDSDVSRSEIEVSASEKEKKLRSPRPIRVVDSPSPERKNTKDSSSSGSDKDEEKDTIKEKIDLSPSVQKLNYSMEKSRIIEDIKVPDDWLADDFEVVLRYIYTGKATVKSQQQAERVSAIGFEYLLDNLMKFCQRSTTFPASFAEDDLLIAAALRKMVGNATGSDLSFVVKRKKLFAHKVLVSCFSDTFREVIKAERARKYIDVPCMDSESRHLNSFIEFMRLVYGNFSVVSAARVKELDLGDLMAIAVTYKEPRLYQILAQPNVLTNENVASIYEVATENNLEAVSKVCFNYLNKYFSTIVRDQNIVANWSKNFVKELVAMFEEGKTSWNWLDLLWLAHNRGMTELEHKAVMQLSLNINVDNVVQILIGAHHCGAKGLRSECVDYLLKQSVMMEQYSRMRATSDQVMVSLSGLSVSLNNEMSQKVSSQVSNLKDPAVKNNKNCCVCNSTFSHFGNKKHSCTLCKRLICNDCLQKGQKLPKVFGHKEKSKNVCVTCNQLVSLIATPAQQEEAKVK